MDHRRQWCVGFDESRLDHVSAESLVLRVLNVTKGNGLERAAPDRGVDVGEKRDCVSLRIRGQQRVVHLKHHEWIRAKRTEVVDDVPLHRGTAIGGRYLL